MSKDPYDVGRGKPPVHTRFPKGQSGNPSGRPKGRRSVSEEIAAALAERVTVNEHGKRRSITKLQAAVKQMANKAAGGDQRVAKVIIELLHQAGARDDAVNGRTALSADGLKVLDLAILAALKDRNTVPEGGVDD